MKFNATIWKYFIKFTTFMNVLLQIKHCIYHLPKISNTFTKRKDDNEICECLSVYAEGAIKKRNKLLYFY